MYFYISGINQDGSNDGPGMSELDPQLKELFLPFRVFCTRKDVSIQSRNFKRIHNEPANIDQESIFGI